jgi:hypothetical protein
MMPTSTITRARKQLTHDTLTGGLAGLLSARWYRSRCCGIRQRVELALLCERKVQSDKHNLNQQSLTI